MRARISVFITIVQSILLLAHLFVYATLAFFLRPLPPAELIWLRLAFALLFVSFVPVTMLAFRFYNWFVRALYILSAVWIGLLNFLFLAAIISWIAYSLVLVFHLPIERRTLGAAMLIEAVLVTLYGIVNAARPRIQRVTVKLPGLPPSWRGRVAAMLSDTHLGHVRSRGFLSRIVARLESLRPDIIFFCGDHFDGTAIDARRAADPWKPLAAATPFGIYFATGNHEEFRDLEKFTAALQRAGLRVLRDEKVDVDGLQILGIDNRDSSRERFSAILDGLPLDRSRASVLLLHMPVDLDLSERHGISLQLSGHTHGGQIFPATLFVHRIFRSYAYGLQRFREMLVYTSCGVGTWGPPLRVGTRPEIVLIRLE